MIIAELERYKQDIEAALRDGESYRTIASRLGCHHDTVAKFVKQHLPEFASKADGGGHNRKLTDPLDEMDLLQAELNEYKTAARAGRKVDVQAERLLQEIRGITPAATPSYEAPDVAEGNGHRHAHVLLLSDLHMGEVVNAEAMNGLGEYDFEILTTRMHQITESLVSFQNARPYPIEELRIWSLGDMVGGKHHQELAETNEFGLAQQSWRTGMLLGQFVEGLVEHYPKIHITGVAGNHSRMNEKAQSKQVFDSFDWLANKTAELYLRNYSTVTHDYPLSAFALDHVAGKTILLGHGDGVRSSMPGVPWGGVLRRFNQLKTTYARLHETLDYWALGHFHQPCVVPGIFMNGAIKGPDEWVLKTFGTADPWCQLLLTFDKNAERLTDVSYINGE
jgi:transposase